MQSIYALIQSCSFPAENEVNDIITLRTAIYGLTCTLDFWGRRTVSGQDRLEKPLYGSAPLTELFDKLLQLCQCTKPEELNLKDRKMAFFYILDAEALFQFSTAPHEEGDVIEKYCFLTRIFFYIRKFFGCDGSSSFEELRDWGDNKLNLFTVEMYKETFKKDKIPVETPSQLIAGVPVFINEHWALE